MTNILFAAALVALASVQTAPDPHQGHAQHGQLDQKGMQHEGHDMACCKDKAADCCKDEQAGCCKHDEQGGSAQPSAEGHHHQR